MRASGKRLALAVTTAVGLGSVAATGIGATVAYRHTQQTASARSADQSSNTGAQGNSRAQGSVGESGDDGGQGSFVPGDGNNDEGFSQQAPPVQVLPGTGSSPHTNSSGS
jgi:hypothetical protein